MPFWKRDSNMKYVCHEISGCVSMFALHTVVKCCGLVKNANMLYEQMSFYVVTLCYSSRYHTPTLLCLNCVLYNTQTPVTIHSC
jgi:hypothetical protein